MSILPGSVPCDIGFELLGIRRSRGYRALIDGTLECINISGRKSIAIPTIEKHIKRKLIPADLTAAQERIAARLARVDMKAVAHKVAEVKAIRPEPKPQPTSWEQALHDNARDLALDVEAIQDLVDEDLLHLKSEL